MMLKIIQIHRNVLVTLLALFSFTLLQSQTIEGYVFDKTTNEPMQGVTVYFDATSIGTVTNAEGYFELTTDTQITATLIVSYIGYTSVYIDTPYEGKLFKVYMEEKSFDLEEVVLHADPFSREQKLAVFKREFLGKNYEGACTIENIDAVTVTYNMNSSKLLAYASEPLKITNAELGYEITYNLVTFEATYTQNTLSRPFLKGVYYAGTSFFLDVSKGANKYARKRRKVYYGSTLHFIRTLAAEKLPDEKYRMFKGSFQINPNDHFVVKDSLGYKYITASQPEWNILYKKEVQSALEITEEGFFVDNYGNFTPITAILFGGYMGDMRFKEMLPLDYYPK